MSFKPRKDRTDPLAMLLRSHGRLREVLASLRAAAEAMVADPADPAAREAVEEARGFLAHSVVRHEQDEEESLFPRLVSEPLLARVLDELATQHRDHQVLSTQLETVVGIWERRAPTQDDARELARIASDIAAAYERHLAREEQELFPVAQRTLSAHEQRAIAREMQARRGRGSD